MSTYYSPSAEAEKAARYAAAAGLLLVLAAVAWVLFAIGFSDDLTSEGPPVLVGLLLGTAVTLTVFSAALGVMAVIQTLHSEQIKVLRSGLNL